MSVIDILANKDLTDYIEGLVPQGDGTFRMACPLHHGSNPTSFCVFPTNTWYSFCCDAGGDIFDYVMQRDSCDFTDAVKTLCEFYNIDEGQDKAYTHRRSEAERNEILCKRYQHNLPSIHDYLVKRGFNEDTISLFRFGYAARAGNLIIPLINQWNQIVGFTARQFDREPKYRHTRNSTDSDLFIKRKFWFNLVNARKCIKRTKRLWVVEGHLDAASITQQGEAAVAYLGIIMSKDQLLELKKYFVHMPDIEIIIVPDADGKAITHIPKLRTMFSKLWPNCNLRIAKIDWEGIKDANDILVAGKNIKDVKTENVDVFTVKYLVSQCTNQEQEYSVAQQFVSTVSSQLIKADIAKTLAERWKQDLEDVRRQLLITAKLDDEILSSFKDPLACIDDYMDMIKQPGFTLGWPGIDNSFGKLRKKKVFLIGAYSKTGKTNFLIEILLHSILRLHLHCIVFSMEMEAAAFMQVMLCKLFGVTSGKLENMMKSPDSSGQIIKVQEKLGNYLYLCDENDLSFDDVKQRVLLANDKMFSVPADRVFVDYFQYLKGTTEYTDVSATAKAMKPFAKTLNTQLFMLSQFSRTGNQYGEPLISSFRGGNDLESSLDYGILLWRPALNPDMPELEREKCKYITKVKLISRDGLRNGEYFSLRYDPKTTRLEEVYQPKH